MGGFRLGNVIEKLGNDVWINHNGVLNDASNVGEIEEIFNALSAEARASLENRVVFVNVSRNDYYDDFEDKYISEVRFCTEDATVYAELYNGNVEEEDIDNRLGMSRSLRKYLTIEGWNDVALSSDADIEMAFGVFNATINMSYFVIPLIDVVSADLSCVAGMYDDKYLAIYQDSRGNRFEVSYWFYEDTSDLADIVIEDAG